MVRVLPSPIASAKIPPVEYDGMLWTGLYLMLVGLEHAFRLPNSLRHQALTVCWSGFATSLATTANGVRFLSGV